MPTRRETLALMSAAMAASTNAHAAPKWPGQRVAVAPYTAACLQTRVLPTHGRDGSVLADNLAANVRHMEQTIERCCAETGARLLVFSEFCLQMPQARQTSQQWVQGAIRIPGPETERIAAAASRAGAYVAFNAVEFIPEFPDRYFLAGVLIGPDGNVLLNYRKLYGLTSKTRPSDILPQWLDRFGAESLLPVADTPVGRIGVTIGTDLMWPELARGLAFKGAEVFANCFASPNNPPSLILPDPAMGEQPNLQNMARRLRGYENLAYVLSANLGPVGPEGSGLIGNMQPSEIVDFRGNPLAVTTSGAEQWITAEIDIEALRTARCAPDDANMLLQVQSDLHAPDYAAAHITTPGAFANVPITDGSEHTDVQKANIRRLIESAVLVPPAGFADYS